MDEFFDLVANILNQGNPEQALTLLSQVTDSSERYNTLLQQARETLSQKLMKQIQQAIAANTPDQARALIAEYRSKLGPNPTIDILETTLASAPVAPQAVPSTPPVSSEPPLVIPQPVQQPVQQPAPQPVQQPIPQPVQQVTPQPMPQSVPPVSSEPPVVKPQPIPASGPISSSSETKVFSSQPQPVAQPEPQAYTPSQSYMPASTPPAKKSKRWLIWLIAVLVLLGAMAASYFFITPVKDFVNKTFGIGSSTTTSMADENTSADDDFFDDDDFDNGDSGNEDDEWGEDDWADDDSSSEETTDEEDLSSNEEEAEPVKPQKENQVQNNTAQNTNQNKPDRTQNTNNTNNNTNATQTVVEDNKVYTNVEPSYPGGPAKLVQYLNNSKHKKVGSAHVNVSFVVEKDGSVREASIMSSNNSSANEEALRVVRSLRMNPATVYGKPVRSKYSVSVDW